jgi:hypothetical protein
MSIFHKSSETNEQCSGGSSAGMRLPLRLRIDGFLFYGSVCPPAELSQLEQGVALPPGLRTRRNGK